MESQATLFNSVLTRILESFACHLRQALSDFENSLANSFTPSDTKSKLLSTFDFFPREIPKYQSSIFTLCDIAGCNPELILHIVTKMAKELIKTGQSPPFTTLHSLFSNFKQDNPMHCQLFLNFDLIFVTDLICAIIVKYPPNTRYPSVARCGYLLCEPNSPIPKLHHSILRQWSVILSILSETNFEATTQLFSHYSGSSSFQILFKLVSRVRFDLDGSADNSFLDEVLSTLRLLIKKRQLTSSVLKSVSLLLTTVQHHEEILQTFFDLAWNLKSDANLKDGAFSVISTLFPHLPKMISKESEFYQKRVYAHAPVDSKLSRSLRLFQRLIFGSHVDPRWLFWSSSPRVSPFCFVSWNSEPYTSQTDPDSFSSIFMKFFFAKANFSVCPQRFRDVLLSLFSLDPSYFEQFILPEFLKLPSKDPRFITLLMTVPVINSSDFQSHSFSRIPANTLKDFNDKMKSKILKSASIFETDPSKSGICFSESDTKLTALIEEADQTIAQLFEASKVDVPPLSAELDESTSSPSRFTLPIQLLKALPSVLSESDFDDDRLMMTVLSLSSSVEIEVSSSAFYICRSIFTKTIHVPKFINCLISYLKTPRSPESTYVCISLLLSIVQSKPSLPTPTYLDIEMISTLCLSSSNPSTRYFSFVILQTVSKILGPKSLGFYINSNKNIIEGVVKERLNKKSSFSGVPFDLALRSHFFDVWLIFLSEISMLIVSMNYSPLITRMSAAKQQFLDSIIHNQLINSPSAVGMLVLLLSSYFHVDSLFLSSPAFVTQPFEPFSSSEDKRGEAAQYIKDMLLSIDGWQDQIAFSVIPLLHFSLFPQIVELLVTVREDQLPDASSALVSMLKAVSSAFVRSILPRLLMYLSVMQSFFISHSSNSPRVIIWTPESEQICAKMGPLIRDYCQIHTICFSHNNKQISEEEWSLPSREIAFRFLVNWSMTTSEQLSSVRDSAAEALVSIVRVGPMFNDVLLFDDPAISLFVKIEQRGMSVLSFLLYFHVELLLEIYVDCCYTHQKSASDLFFEAIFMCFEADKSEFLYKLTGQLLLLGLVFHERGHQRADEFLTSLSAIICANSKKEFKTEAMTRQFSYATEAILAAALRIIQMKNTRIPVKDVVESIRPWIQSLRLLPKQTTCIPSVPPEFRHFTPYQFLSQLMQATESVTEDDFSEMASLWTDLLRSPDHTDLIPLFISEWPNPQTKQKMFIFLLSTDSMSIVKRLSLRCSFAYYFHITACLSKPFEDELWVMPLLSLAFQKNSEELLSLIPSIVHFSFLFSDSRDLLDTLCRQYSIEVPREINHEVLVSTVRQFISKLRQSSENGLDIWANEAAKWLLGCISLKFAYLSLMIYNQISRPSDPIVVSGVCKAVCLHLENSAADSVSLQGLIGESFKFYTNNFNGNEVYAFNYASAFLDCVAFMENALPLAAQLFLKSLSSQLTNTNAWNSIISIVRPLLAKIESDDQTQKIFELLIKTSSSEELMMIVAPIKDNNPLMFPSALEVKQLLTVASSTSMCKALVHYALMIESASTDLMNSIFRISAIIADKIVNENNRSSLAVLYKAALNSLSICPSAIEFVKVIAKKESSVASKSVYEFYDWARSSDDVVRSVKRLIVDREGITTLTDCSTLSSVYNLLNCDALPKIMPFTAQREMIEGMMRAKQVGRQRRSMSVRRMSHSSANYGSPAKESSLLYTPPPSSSFECDFGPIELPDSLVMSSSMFEPAAVSGLMMGAQDFLNAAEDVSKTLKV